MKCRLFAVAALLTLLPARAAAVPTLPAQSVSAQIDAGLLKQFILNDPASARKYYGADRSVALCRHEQMLALFGKVYGYGVCVLVYQNGSSRYAQVTSEADYFRAIVAGGKVTALESPREGHSREDMHRLFPWYVRNILARPQSARMESHPFERARAEAAKQLGLPLKPLPFKSLN